MIRVGSKLSLDYERDVIVIAVIIIIIYWLQLHWAERKIKRRIEGKMQRKMEMKM